MVIGVVLAAGRASRLPNKPLLPAEGGIVIESGIQMLMRSRVDRIICVVSPDSLLPLVLKQRGHRLTYRYQYTANGVLDALGCARTEGATRYLVTFCDNVFCSRENAVCDAGDYVAVRAGSSDSLDGWNGERWVERGEPMTHVLAGWYSIKACNLPAGGSVLAWLNVIHAKPALCKGDWFDVGTQKGYTDYVLHRSDE